MPSVNGVAYLSLSGNSVEWNNIGGDHSFIRLAGSRFHDVVPMVTLAISALCLLGFAVIFVGECVVCCSRGKTLPWGTVWFPIGCMICFFATDIANRVMHELQLNISSGYLGIDVGIGSFSSLADGLLQVYLYKYSPLCISEAHWLPKSLMLLAVGLNWICSLGSRGTQIYNVIMQINGGPDVTNPIWLDLQSASSGMLVLFALGWAIFAVQYIRKVPVSHGRRGRLCRSIGVLAFTYLGRNAVMLVFTLIYSQYNQNASMAMQLLYIALYGFLSVAIYTCIVLVAHARQSEEQWPSNADVSVVRVQPAKMTDGMNTEYPRYGYHYHPVGA